MNDPKMDAGGMHLYGNYAGYVLPILADIGAELITPSLDAEDPLEGGFDPFMVGFGRYPSDRAFNETWNSDRTVRSLTSELTPCTGRC